jgi:hypothetical protein
MKPFVFSNKARKPKPSQIPRIAHRTTPYPEPPPDQVNRAKFRKSLEQAREDRDLENQLKEVWDNE